MITTASTATPTMMYVHGTLSVVVVFVVVVVEVEESPVVVLGAVAEEPFVVPLPAAGPVEVVVLEAALPALPAAPDVWAMVIVGAAARRSASRMRPRRRTERIISLLERVRAALRDSLPECRANTNVARRAQDAGSMPSVGQRAQLPSPRPQSEKSSLISWSVAAAKSSVSPEHQSVRLRTKKSSAKQRIRCSWSTRRIALMRERTMDRFEVDRRRKAALEDISSLVGGGGASLRVVNAEDVLVIATVPDKSARPGALHIIQRHFPNGAVKFKP
jgi:hypothetical protein